MTYSFASPGNDYLGKIGTLAYAVSSMEWSVLGDLPKHSAELPANCTQDVLAGSTTGGISRRLSEAAGAVSDSQVSDFLRTAGRVLGEAAEIRNAVLHARPVTVGGNQRLYRWKADIDPFVIDDDWLDRKLQEVDALSIELERARVP